MDPIYRYSDLLGVNHQPIIAVDRETNAILTAPAGAGGPPQSVVIVPPESATAPSSDAIREAAEEITVAAGQRAFVQNLSTAPLIVKMGAGASASSLSFILNGGTEEDDGLGGATPKDSPLEGYVGVVSFFSTDFRYVAWVR